MESLFACRVVSAERLNGGVIIMFNDGKCAVYSASLLYATLGQAELIDLDPEDWDDGGLVF